jgi:hypothetical protein
VQPEITGESPEPPDQGLPSPDLPPPDEAQTLPPYQERLIQKIDDAIDAAGRRSAAHGHHDNGPPRFPVGADNWGPSEDLATICGPPMARLRCRTCVNEIGTMIKVDHTATSPNTR